MEIVQPKLRFPEFKGNWETKQLGDIGDVKMCRRIFNEETTSTGEIPFFKIGSFGKVADAFITKELYLNYRNKFSFPKKGDILISAAGTIGRTVVYNGEDAYFQDSNIVWIENDNTISSNDFLFYIYQIVSFNTEGGTIQRLYNSILKSTKYYNPSLPEQIKIANFLSEIDEKINLLKENKSLLEEYKKGIMQKIFNQKIRFKGDNGNDFEDWKEKSLSEVTLKKSSNISANKIEENIGEYIIYGASGILKTVDFYLMEEDYISIIKDGAGVGRIFYCEGKTSVLGTLDMISPIKNINTYFIFCLLSNIDFTQFITGSTIPHIYYKDYSKVICGIPCLEEQTKISNFLSSIDEKIELVNTQIQDTQEYKKGLLQQMFI